MMPPQGWEIAIRAERRERIDRALLAAWVFILAMLFLPGCSAAVRVASAPVVGVVNLADWVRQRAECRIKCPSGETCTFSGGGVFGGVFGGGDYACKPKPSPEPSPSPKAASPCGQCPEGQVCLASGFLLETHRCRPASPEAR